MVTMDLAPSRRRQALGTAAVTFATLLCPVALAVAVWIAAHLVPGDDAALTAKLGAVSLVLAAGLVAVNRLLAWSASEFDLRVSERLLVSGSVFRDTFPAVDRPLTQYMTETTPARPREARNALEASRRHPALVARMLCCGLAMFVAATMTVHAGRPVVQGTTPSIATSIAAFLAVTIFAVACRDLAVGRHRSLIRPWHTTRWAPAYCPDRRATLVPTVPVLTAVLLPFLAGWWVITAPSPWTTKFALAAGVLACWEVVWASRDGAGRAGMLLAERLTAPLSRLVACAVNPAWFLTRGLAWVTGAGALAALAVASAESEAALDQVGQLGALLLGITIMLGVLLHNWRRPHAVRVISAKALMDDHLTADVERRIQSLMLGGRYLVAMLVLLAAVAATPPS
jgi:hypothetical protein